MTVISQIRGRDLEAVFSSDEFLLAREMDRKTLGGWHINTAVQFVRDAVTACVANLEEGKPVVAVINQVRNALGRHKYSFVLQDSHLIQWMNLYFDGLSFQHARESGTVHKDQITALAQSQSFTPRQRIDAIQRYLSEKPQECSSDAIVTLFQQLVFIAPPETRTRSLQQSLQKFLLFIVALINKNAISFQSSQIFRIVHAFRFLEPSCIPGKVQDWIIEQAEPLKENLSYRDCVILLQGFYAFRQQPSVATFCDSIFVWLEEQSHSEISNIETCSLRQLYSMYKRSVPEWLSREYDFVRGLEQFPPSSLERKVFDLLQRLFPENNGIYFVHFFHESGYEMDVFFPELNLNIEIDGPFHFRFRNQLKDDQRDAVLLDQQVRVIRVTVDDYEARVQEIYKQYQEYLAQKEVQEKARSVAKIFLDRLMKCEGLEGSYGQSVYNNAYSSMNEIIYSHDPIKELLEKRKGAKLYLMAGQIQPDYSWKDMQELIPVSLWNWMNDFVRDTELNVLFKEGQYTDLPYEVQERQLLFTYAISKRFSEAVQKDGIPPSMDAIYKRATSLLCSFALYADNEPGKFEQNLRKGISSFRRRPSSDHSAFGEWTIYVMREGIALLQDLKEMRLGRSHAS